MGLEQLLKVYDHLPAAEAVARAWADPGPKSGTWHQYARRDVRDLMPLLGRALDRLLVELEDALPATDPDLWAEEPALSSTSCAEISCRCGHLHRRHSVRGGRCRAHGCGCEAYRCSCRGVRRCAGNAHSRT